MAEGYYLMGSGEVVEMTYWRRKSAAEKNA